MRLRGFSGLRYSLVILFQGRRESTAPLNEIPAGLVRLVRNILLTRCSCALHRRSFADAQDDNTRVKMNSKCHSEWSGTERRISSLFAPAPCRGDPSTSSRHAGTPLRMTGMRILMSPAREIICWRSAPEGVSGETGGKESA